MTLVGTTFGGSLGSGPPTLPVTSHKASLQPRKSLFLGPRPTPSSALKACGRRIRSGARAECAHTLKLRCLTKFGSPASFWPQGEKPPGGVPVPTPDAKAETEKAPHKELPVIVSHGPLRLARVLLEVLARCQQSKCSATMDPCRSKKLLPSAHGVVSCEAGTSSRTRSWSPWQTARWRSHQA